jgi:hypothetical protein
VDMPAYINRPTPEFELVDGSPRLFHKQMHLDFLDKLFIEIIVNFS